MGSVDVKMAGIVDVTMAGIVDVKKAVAKAAVKGRHGKRFAKAFSSELTAIRAEKEKEREFLKKENKGLKIQQDETVLIWFSGKEEKHLKLSHVSRIISGQRTGMKSPFKLHGPDDGDGHIEARYPAILFKQQLTASVEKIYSLICDNLKKDSHLSTYHFSTAFSFDENVAHFRRGNM